MSTSAPSVDVIVCTRDRPDDLLLCLGSIKDQLPSPSQVIVVTGSEESCPDGIQDQFPSLCIEVIECYEHNISISRNAGLERSQAGIVLFIDDDAQARQGWVQAYIQAFDQNPQAWAIGGDVFDARISPPLTEFSHGLVSPLGRQVPVQSSPLRRATRNYFPNVKGCNFGIRRAQVMELGGFDPFFAFAFDESDLMMSIHRAGGQVPHEPGAIVDHAHTPGHYRLDGPLDRDWRVEYASHTMFMLKHGVGMNRVLGRFVVWRRLAKLAVVAAWGMLKGQINLRRFIAILRSSSRGVRDAHKAYAIREEAQ